MHPSLKNIRLPKDLILLFEKNSEIITIPKKDISNSFSYDFCSNSYCFLSGLVKVYILFQGKKIFLYHLPNKNKSLMSFPNMLNEYNLQFRIEALHDTVVLINSNKNILKWSDSYPVLRDYIINSYQCFYHIMLENIQKHLKETLENRLLDYLKLNTHLFKTLELTISIQELAIDLNCTREAISRSLKRLELDHKIIRKSRSILLLEN